MKLKDLQNLTPQQAQKADYDRFYNHDSDGYSPEKNRALIEKTITDYEAMRAKKAEQHNDDYGERADAVVTYLKSLDKGHGESNIEKYFGKRTLAYLRGQQIRDKIMSGLSFKNKAGDIVKYGN